MADPFAVGLAAIDRVMREDVTYDGAGLTDGAILAIYSNADGEAFGKGTAPRRVTFEIVRSALPGRPARDDVITRRGVAWKVNEVNELDEIDRWQLVVRR